MSNHMTDDTVLLVEIGNIAKDYAHTASCDRVALDKLYKPGFFREVECFMTHPEDARLPKIEEQLAHMKYYIQMLCGF